MPQVNNNEVPMYGSDSDDIVAANCECKEPEVKPHQEFVEIDGIRFHVPDSGILLVICNKCNLEIKKGDQND